MSAVAVQAGWYLTCSETQRMVVINDARLGIILTSAYEPRREKTGFLNMRKQRRRSASR